MSGQDLDAFSRAVGVSRRGTLMSLSSAGLSVLGASSVVFAGSSNKKANKRAKKKGRKKCQKQLDQCDEFFKDLCSEEEEPEVCEALFTPCCAFLAQCQTSGFFDCVFASAPS
jgi:hypothetical protein